jgi:RNA-directed DNA polymerase
MDCNLITKLASDKILDKAYDSVCHSRRHSSCNNDIWDLRLNWAREKNAIQQTLLKGSYTFTTTKICFGFEGHYEKWAATDAVVLKALKILLEDVYKKKLSANCYHMKGNGGLKGAVRSAALAQKSYKYVYKSDVSNYYGSIDHSILIDIFKKEIQDIKVLQLINRFLTHSMECDGKYNERRIGISRGTSLSSLIGTIYMDSLDELFSGKKSVFYLRYMDDIIVMANHRLVFKRHIKKINTVLEKLKLMTAFKKTYVGKITPEGFDFLGYHFNKISVSISNTTIDRMKKKKAAKVHRWWARFYESGLYGLRQMKGEMTLKQTISLYEQNWVKWCCDGVKGKCCVGFCSTWASISR